MKNHHKSLIKFSTIAIILTLSSVSVYAAEATSQTTAKAPFQTEDLLRYVLLAVTALFVFIIFALNNMLKLAMKTYRNKIITERNSGLKSIVLILGSSLISTALSAQAAVVPAAVAVGESTVFDNWGNNLLMGGIFILFIVILVLIKTIVTISGLDESAKSLEVEPVRVVEKSFFQKINDTVPIEEEASIDLMHDYDGITELDNKVPSWWSWTFAASILFGVIYLLRMFVLESMPSQYVELERANEAASIAKIEYLKTQANNVDETNVVMLGATDIAQGASLYAANCVACHGNIGQGGVGPNLADDYWIHKGGIKDIFYSLKYGWQEKGMKAWKDDFSPSQIAQLSSFVKTLHGTNPPGGKAKQGELYNDEDENNKIEAKVPTATTDSVQVK